MRLSILVLVILLAFPASAWSQTPDAPPAAELGAPVDGTQASDASSESEPAGSAAPQQPIQLVAPAIAKADPPSMEASPLPSLPVTTTTVAKAPERPTQAAANARTNSVPEQPKPVKAPQAAAAPTPPPARQSSTPAAVATGPNPYEAAVKAAKERMMADPVSAYELAVEAEKLANGSDVERKGTALWLVGEALNRQNRAAEAAPVLDRGLEMVRASGQKTKLLGDLMMARAASAKSLGDFALAMTSYKNAHDVFAGLGEDRSRALSLQQVGSIYTDARDYQKALEYYQRAGEAYGGDPSIDLARLNNIATAHRLLGQYAEAEAGLKDALAIAEEMRSPVLRARILTNLAAVQLMSGRVDEAEASVQRGLAVSSEGEKSGWEPFLWGVEAQIVLKRGNPLQAADLLSRTFSGQDITKTAMPFRDFHETAFNVFTILDEPRLALTHLNAFKRLDDEARDVSAAANTALVGAQFDFASQELRLANLRTEALEKQVELQKARARQRLMVFAGLGALVLVMLLGGTAHYLSMRRSRNEVRSANVKLSDSNTALEKALRAKSEFLATTSHEIRTPLNGILGMTQILMQQRELSGDARERVELVHASGLTMKAIVDDILDVAKMQTGKITIEPVTFDVRETLSGVAQIWRDSAQEKGVELSWDLGQSPRGMIGDERRIRQVVFNLLSNAVKFTDRGDIFLSAGADRGEKPEFWVRVADTGPGIPAEELDAIFEPFHQADGGTTRKHGGTGLGLSICRSLARAMGGDVEVESKLGEGSIFTLRLPLEEAVSGNAVAGDAAQGRRILLLDSNLLRISILEAMLEEPERAVLTSETVEDACRLLALGGVEGVLVFADVLADNAAGVMDAVMALSDAIGEARLVVQIGDMAGLEPPMLRLAGATDVLSGPFDAMASAAALSGSTANEGAKDANPPAGASAA